MYNTGMERRKAGVFGECSGVRRAWRARAGSAFNPAGAGLVQVLITAVMLNSAIFPYLTRARAFPVFPASDKSVSLYIGEESERITTMNPIREKNKDKAITERMKKAETSEKLLPLPIPVDDEGWAAY